MCLWYNKNSETVASWVFWLDRRIEFRKVITIAEGMSLKDYLLIHAGELYGNFIMYKGDNGSVNMYI